MANEILITFAQARHHRGDFSVNGTEVGAEAIDLGASEDHSAAAPSNTDYAFICNNGAATALVKVQNTASAFTGGFAMPAGTTEKFYCAPGMFVSAKEA